MTKHPRVSAPLSSLLRGVTICFCVGVVTVAMPWAITTGGTLVEQLDARASAIAKDTVEQTAAAFAIAKAVNAVLSVASSATIGVSAVVADGSVAVGQVLNPLDRLADDFATLLLIAAIAACATALLVEAGGHADGAATVAVIALLAAAGWLGRRRAAGALLRAAFAVLLVVRIGLPLALVGSQAGYAAVLAPHFDQAQSDLAEIEDRIKATFSGTVSAKDRTGEWLLRRWYHGAADRANAVSSALSVLRQDFDTLFSSAFTLIAVLAVKILVAPLALVRAGWWAAGGLSRALAG
jgi:hypothetical protein